MVRVRVRRKAGQCSGDLDLNTAGSDALKAETHTSGCVSGGVVYPATMAFTQRGLGATT
jgi:hypothetical protein